MSLVQHDYVFGSSTSSESEIFPHCDMNGEECDESDTSSQRALIRSSTGRRSTRSLPGSRHGWAFSNYASIDPLAERDDSGPEIAILTAPALQLSSGIDSRSLRLMSIVFHEGQRVLFLKPWPLDLFVQTFYQEPAYRNLMNALITFMHADYQPASADSKAYAYQCVLNAIKRMREAPHEMSDASQLRCRALLALLETVRKHGGYNFLPVATAVFALLEEWQADMQNVTAAVASRRRRLIGRYSRVMIAGKNHWNQLLAVQSPTEDRMLPSLPSRPDFRAHFIEYLASMEITSLITESYGYSICEPADRQALKDRLASWYTAFDAAMSHPELLDMRELAQAQFYLAHYIRSSILLDACVVDTEARYAKHEADFVAILECIESVLASGHWLNVSMWLGVVCPLFFTAVHCRKRDVRHRALELLRTNDVSERSWNSRIAFLIASAVMALETDVASTTDKYDQPIVRLLSTDFKPSKECLVVKYIHMPTKQHRTYEMLIIGEKDLSDCSEVTTWPLVAEVRTHGASFSQCPLGGPLDSVSEDAEVDENDYLKWLKLMLKPKRYTKAKGGVK